MAWRLHWSAVCLAGAIAACGAEQAPGPIENPMLQLWCDQHPCGWEVEGKAKRVGTWHPDDYALELVDDDAALSQVRPELDYTLAACFSFSLMAHVAKGARVFLELDFLDDGKVEFSAPIPKSDWEVRTFDISTPTWYEGVRFRVRKAGPGEVIVAELNVELAKLSCPRTPLPLSDRPAGALCENDEECASGGCRIAEVSKGGTCD
jgi:hypothetical protein